MAFENVVKKLSTVTLALVRFLIWIGSSVVEENAGVVSSELVVPNGATPNSTSGKSGSAARAAAGGTVERPADGLVAC